MYRKEKPLPLKSSASMLSNNLSVLVTPEKNSMNYAVIHKSVVNIVSSSTDGSSVTNKQVICKEPSANQNATPMIIQCKWVTLPSRPILVLTTLKGIQIYEYDGSAMIFFHALGNVHSSDAQEYGNYGRGIAGVGENTLCVGTQLGEIVVLQIPQKGTNVMTRDSLMGHKVPICDLAAEGGTLASSDEQGNIIVWTQGDGGIRQREYIAGSGSPCSTLALWNDILIGGFGNGQLRLFNAKNGKLSAMVNAHSRWINAVDVAKDSGLLLSASDDTFVRVWKLKPGPTPEIEYCHAESVTDLQLCGAKFIHNAGMVFCVSGYDSSDINFFVRN